MAVDPPDLRSALAKLQQAKSMDALSDYLQVVTIELGFSYFVLAHHLHPSRWLDL
jgi:hypothetical protein